MRVNSLADLNRRNALLHGPRIAAIHGQRELTYEELYKGACSLAQSWFDAGASKGDRIAIVARNRPEVLVAFGACEMAGLVAVPLNHRLAAAELAEICRDCEPRVLLYEENFENTIRTLQREHDLQCETVSLTSPSFAEQLKTSVGDATREGSVEVGDLGYLIYTSGTTGRPKGVMLSQGALAAMTRNIALETGARLHDRLAAVMPLFHVGARCKTLGYAYRGACTVLIDSFDAASFLDMVEARSISALHLAPSMLQSVIAEQERQPRRLSSVRAIHYAAAPMPLPVLERALELFGPVFHQYYGMTETGAGGTVLHPADHDLDAGADRERLRSAGQPSADADVRVVRDDGSVVTMGEVGEVEIRCSAAMAGYWRNPEATIQATHDGWIRTGDVGSLDSRQYLFILDRKKDMIVSGGENIYPREVEEALLSHPAVAEAAVVGVPDPKWGEAVLAFVTPHKNATPTADELINHCRSLIASYKKPKEVRFLEALPKNATGKVDKKLLRAPFWAGQARKI